MIKKCHGHLLVAVACLFLLAACSSANSPEGAAKAYVNALAHGNGEALAQVMYMGDSPHDAKEQASIRKFTRMMATYAQHSLNEKYGGLDSFEVINVDQSDNTHATVQLKLHYGNGSAETKTLGVTKQDGQWLVHP